MAGLVLMLTAVTFGFGKILSPKDATGLVLFDAFEFIKQTMSSRAAGLGLNIMAVGGFARYMSHIGASKALVKVAIKPLLFLRAPYLVMALAWIVGMLMGLCITSASGLAMLLMATLFPVLVGLGVSRLSATAVIATTLCFDWSPSDSGTILSAATAKIDPVLYWTTYQIPVVICGIVVVSVLHYVVQKWFDHREGHIVEVTEYKAEKDDNPPPMMYAILPTIPLVLILIFSNLCISGIKMDIVKAMFIGLVIAMVFEYLRFWDAKKVFADIQSFFDGLGLQMANVVTLIVAGETFAKGHMIMGTIDAIITSAQDSGFGVVSMIIVMVAIISVSAIVMGSGNAPFFAFAGLTPEVASKVSIDPVLMLLPMHFAASISRNLSPISAIIIVASNMGGVSPLAVVKRTAIPMVGAMLVNVIATLILFYW